MGVWESRRLPGSGAGLSPDRMLAGSEGVLGVITQAWMRVQPRPSHRRSAGRTVRQTSSRGAECVRAISQSGLHPSNCRLLDGGEAGLTMAADGSHALLVLGFESTDHPVDAAMARALEICAEHGGYGASRDDGRAETRWAHGAGAFLGAPYVRDMLVAVGVLAETFETAITWERFSGFHERVSAAAAQALREACGGEGQRVLSLHPHLPRRARALLHVLAPARRGEEVEQWARSSGPSRTRSSRRAARSPTTTPSGAITGPGMTGSARSRSRRRCAAQGGGRPAGIMNPGVLIDPLP